MHTQLESTLDNARGTVHYQRGLMVTTKTTRSQPTGAAKKNGTAAANLTMGANVTCTHEAISYVCL